MNRDIKRKAKQITEKLSFFQEYCRRHHFKITPQRVSIYKELMSSDEHPSALKIFRKIRIFYPNISLGTVNTTLLTFAKIGLIKIVESSGDPKRFDSKLTNHHHFRCLKCGKIVDFCNQEYDALKIPNTLKKKFIVLDKIVHLQGLCDKCKNV